MNNNNLLFQTQRVIYYPDWPDTMEKNLIIGVTNNAKTKALINFLQDKL